MGERPNIPNHYAATLSELDMMVVRAVPPGGNWKDIPESVPSKRLEQIRESFKAGKGSRSTYYGRLLPDMPAYTINTYFSRPGNGCHMHYSQDRTLSQREAARIQSFPDGFMFLGSKGRIDTQIGNAVPPLLAYQIARALPFHGIFIDLFCGAGGLALGFVWAGWQPILANDIMKEAIETHKANIGGDAFVGDITKEDVQRRIIDAALKAKADYPDTPLFILGGPPCQGFSTANTRRGEDDERNWLFKSYVKIVKAVEPDGFVFENVRGMLNMSGGEFFEIIKEDLSSSIEKIKINQINAAEYGVPQRRERVIILGGSKELIDGFELNPITAAPKKLDFGDSPLPHVIGVEAAIGDLPALTPGQDGSDLPYSSAAQTPYQRFMRGEIGPQDYLNNL